MQKYIFYTLACIFFLCTPYLVASQNAEELKTKIDNKTEEIKKLEEEIKQYTNEINTTTKQAKTLQSTIKTLDTTEKKIKKDITLTETKISKTQYTIQQIDDELNKISSELAVHKKGIGQTIQILNEKQKVSIVQTLLASHDLSQLWRDIDDLTSFQTSLKERTDNLKNTRLAYEQKQNDLSIERRSLLNLKSDLSGKKQAVESTKSEKAAILEATKNKEQAFRDLVKTKEEQKRQFEEEVFQYESQLNYLVDRDSYPEPRQGIIQWPLENIFITQKFGKTVAAKRLYVSGSHNGVDFRAAVGTKVMSVLAGTVAGTGNTDQFRGCYSFGKWVMVRHPNGLASVYGHLSSIAVSPGQEVQAGDTLGQSGNTGYSTGPHLHLGLYASQGVRIEKFVRSRGCKEATMPIADLKAYLDPLAYLPKQ